MNKEIILSNQAPKPVGPYSQAVRVGDLVFVSGQIPINPETGELFLGDIKDQTKLVLNSLKGIIKEAGGSLKNIVKITIYLTDLSCFTQVNEVYSSYFEKDAPARVCVGVASLPKGVSIEIDAIAVINRG